MESNTQSSENKNLAIINKASIVEEMQNSYLDYAMSVIVARALPDVRDGLKPVQRRILYTMHKMGLDHGAKYRKSASIVGDVMGKYHPHGDTAIYDTMVRLAQDFSCRYMLVDGQGNFGSIDGDPPAHMRYTESRMKKISSEMLRDINKETVEFRPTYDDMRKEPIVLPAAVPQLLLNGQDGIAVGMATKIPPHNLGELIDACVYLVENPEAETVDLLKFVKGPDFPTAGYIYNKEDIKNAYISGRGGVVTRGKAAIEENSKKGFQIVITEMTFQTNKSTFLSTIADLVKNKKIEGIRNIVDESNKKGIRIVIDLKKEASPNKILNQLYKMTDLQKTYHLNMLALVDGLQPEVLGLKAILDYYLKFRFTVVKRSYEYDLRIAREREHILLGLKKALDHIDEIITMIRESNTKEEAHKKLVARFKFSDIQATAILEMRLQQLAGLERKKIEDELKQIQELIASIVEILSSNEKLWGEVKRLLLEVKENYKDERRTKVVPGKVGEFSEEDFVENEDVIIMITKDGYIKRMKEDFHRAQGRGGKGIIGMVTKDEDTVDTLITVKNHEEILFFSTTGRAFKVKAYEIPESQRATKGQALVNFLDLRADEKITSVLPMPQEGQKTYLLMVTLKATVKKVKISDLANIRKSGLIVISLDEDDVLEKAQFTTGNDEIILVTQKGMAIRFKESDVRSMGRNASGVRAVRLKNGDTVIGIDVLQAAIIENPKEYEVFTLTENGFGKRTPIDEYKVQRRSGSGIKAMKINAKTGLITGVRLLKSETLKTSQQEQTLDEPEDAVIISQKGQIIRLPIKDIKTSGRATQGVTLMRLKSDDKVAAVTFI